MINTDREWVDRVRRATGESTGLTSVFEKWRERLKEVMSDSQPQDGQRVFSRQLKKEMFDANPICSICGNKISLIDDAALVLLQPNIAVFSVRVIPVRKAPCAGNGRSPWQARQRRGRVSRERPSGWPVSTPGPRCTSCQGLRPLPARRALPGVLTGQLNTTILGCRSTRSR